MGESGLSRRTLLRGAGVATGATLLGGVSAAAAAQGDESPLGVATAQQAGQPNPGLFLQALPAVNPAWNYRTISYQQFVPRSVAGLDVSLSGTAGMFVNAPVGGTTFSAALDLPQGAVLREAAFECYNGHPTTGLSVGLTRTSLASATPGGNFAFTDSAALKHTVVVSPSVVGTIDNTQFSYGVQAFLQPPGSQFGFFGARVAWTNGLLLSQLSPQARKLDTRNPGPLTGKIINGQTKTLALTPELIVGAKSALVNLTITNTEGSGFLGLFPSGTPWPGTSTINWSGPNQIVANSATVAVSPAGSIDIICGGGGRTHVVVDLLGYYT